MPLIGAALVLLQSGLLFAADPAAADQRMREALRNTALQLRAAETERATLQAAQAESDLKIKTLNGQVENLTKQIGAAEQTAAEQTDENAKLREALQKWEAAHQLATTLAATTESQRAKLAGEVIGLKRVVADQKRKNAEMFRLGNEVLVRYENFGLGTALTAKEPFIGITRVKLENLVQDYGDKLADQRIRE